MKFIFILFAMGHVFASDVDVPPKKEARLLVEKILNSLKDPNSPFQTDECGEIPSEDWLKLLLANMPIEHKFVFSKKCDVQGVVRLTKSPSPIDLNLRHLESV